jgi:hypothetical protein
MFEELGELEEVRILTQKKIIARQLEQARQAGNISISEMARRMGAERQLHLPKDDNYVAPLSGATVTRR